MRSLTTQSRMGCKKYRDVREHQGKVIESYCCGKDVFLSAPTGSALSISLCSCLVRRFTQRDPCKLGFTVWFVFAKFSLTLKIRLLVRVPLRSAQFRYTISFPLRTNRQVETPNFDMFWFK